MHVQHLCSLEGKTLALVSSPVAPQGLGQWLERTWRIPSRNSVYWAEKSLFVIKTKITSTHIRIYNNHSNGVEYTVTPLKAVYVRTAMYL